MKIFFDELKKESPKLGTFKADDNHRNITNQLNSVELVLRVVLNKGNPITSVGFKKIIPLKFSDGYGFLESCEIQFLGNIRSAFIANTKFRLSNFTSPFNPQKDIAEKLVLERATIDIINNSLASLIILGRLFVVNGCRPDNCALDFSPYHDFQVVEKIHNVLSFDHNGEPRIGSLFNPEIRSGFPRHNTKHFEFTKYGNDMSAMAIGLIEIQEEFLRALFR